MLLSKGFEVEIYTSTPTGDVVGFSDRIVANLNGFVREPDSRNVEYITPPFHKYEPLLMALVEPRQKLRSYLRSLGDYTLMPGSTLALGGVDRFYRSDPQNPYHTYIEETYGTNVVTASIHINVGIADLELLIAACRLIRLEAPLYLALSAASPFLNGKATGFHSSRWQMFPKTPKLVPLFRSHRHFVEWTEQQLELGTMQNVRHLWSSVRPNGDNRPYNLNRLELRISDLVIDPVALLSISALLEMRLNQFLEAGIGSSLDPLAPNATKFTPDELADIADRNEVAAATSSLDAVLTHWQTGEQITAREWISNQYEELRSRAKDNGVWCFLSPLKKILEQGNEAQRWLAAYHNGLSPRQIMTDAIASAEKMDKELAEALLLS
ncbi:MULTISPECIES: glutamate--cysteine ligase [Pseudanabaena]|uniref:Glutamate/cysteine ligase n=2 Tax=Pseudanabaena TaxID=1152 RepID=L8N5D4_9CYAN|nr:MULTISPECIES: glutamate--cysteine ligase [Pseudanabaena]ELS33905.1 glutamate/cysteine ligase [Pseudanabaena biceps PCC 7429]MDG3493871.1 glutamate--cysteine ligase [Pseudanabaena catenata USMAC16]